MKVPKISFVLSLLWIGVAMVSAQVETRFYPEGDALSGTRLGNLPQRRSVVEVKKHYPGGP